MGAAPAPVVPFEWDWANFGDSMRATWTWTMSLGKPLAVGLVALGCTLAVVGYIVVQLGWRAYVVAAWRARQRRRKTGL
jgi:uncharacterized protein (DUF2062 family)